MRVIKKINNNVVWAKDTDDKELFVVGKGLGFEKTPYVLSKKDKRIEKIFTLEKNAEQMFNLFEEFSTEIILVTDQIIKDGSAMLNHVFQNNILLALADHLDFAIERAKKNITIDNPLHWEVLEIYPQEVNVAKRALEIVKEKMGIQLPEVEITFIALHFVNAQLGEKSLSGTHDFTKSVKEILLMVEENCKKPFDKNNIEYKRFVTHIRYFVIRQTNQIQLEGNNKVLYETIKHTMPEEFSLVNKIDKMIGLRYNWNCSDSEKVYLAIHINKLIS